ncbi:thiamine-phosphate kinase [Bacillus lacus]|uniref:Thiamine-monophosphate kinase n=1 Tax=Metabacillus lacus TaxID=1983721 RepID=A0A7X2LZD0_9BACI|nr:thiamine-phosphate kinase [Metabacillus lacus]MRX72758.1 thiamine-phosphate kinase [Metabacillus lacus]
MALHDEFSFIKDITPSSLHQADVLVGIGDDAAVYQVQEGQQQILCMDTMVEDIHFKRSYSSAEEIGHKALAVNISDVAAMGGIPKYYAVSIAIPAHWSPGELTAIYQGMKQLGDTYQMDLLGGDTVSTQGKLVITVTVTGETQRPDNCLRSNAKEGDIVFVTGYVGDSAAGLHLLTENPDNLSATSQYLFQRHKMPVPQVEAGTIISASGRASLNDISDGLASELNEIAEASNVTIMIDETMLPISKEAFEADNRQALTWALYGGEDFELVGTASPETFAVIEKECKKAGILITRIGEAHQGEAKVFLEDLHSEVRLLAKGGYNHFQKAGGINGVESENGKS